VHVRPGRGYLVLKERGSFISFPASRAASGRGERAWLLRMIVQCPAFEARADGQVG
jgi:hypothetical protein